MPEIAAEILIILVLTLLNGVFAMAEIAMVASRATRLETLAAEGAAGAATAVRLKKTPERFLSTVQVGITLIGVFAGAYGGATLADHLNVVLQRIPALSAAAPSLSFGLVVCAITYLSLVLGELVPKQLALGRAERIASVLAPPMQGLAWIASPLVWGLTASSRGLLRLVRVKPGDEPHLTVDEIRVLLRQGAAAGVVEAAEHSLVDRAMRFGDRRASTLMTPRTDIVWFDVDMPIGEAMRRMSEQGHTYFPVREGDIDKPLGMVSVKTLWTRLVHQQVPNLRECLTPALFVPETTDALKLLELFKTSGRHVALAVDEYGGIAGLVTIHNVLEAIVGELPTIGEEPDESAVQRPDGSWLLDGLLPYDEMLRCLNLDLDGENDSLFDTVAGFALHHVGRLPRVADVFEWRGWRFEIVDMDGHRIDRVLATQAATQGAADPREAR